MSFYLNAALSLLIGVPMTIGWVRFRKTDRSYVPFVLLLTAGFVNEVISIVLTLQHEPNLLNYNLYVLVEAVLLLWLMKRWQAYRHPAVYYVLQAALIVLWCWESLAFTRLEAVNSVHIIVFSAVIVILAIDVLNRVSYQDPVPLHKNPQFLICLGLAIFFTYSILIEVFFLQGYNDQPFRVGILSLLPYVNLVTNLLFTAAILWVPFSYHYIMRS